MKNTFILLFLGILTQALGQELRLTDSFSTLMQSEIKDSLWVDQANELAEALSHTNEDLALQLVNEAINVSRSENYEKGLIRAIVLKGNVYMNLGLPDQALTYYYHASSHPIDKYPIEWVKLCNNMGEAYRRKQDYDSSLSCFRRALTLAAEHLPNVKPVIIYSNLGEVSLAKGDIIQAKKYFHQCLENALATGHEMGQGYGWYGLAECSFAEGNVSKAITFMKKSLKIRENIDHKRGITQSFLRLGNYYKKLSEPTQDSALHYWNKAVFIAKDLGAFDLMERIYSELFSFHMENENPATAAMYLELRKQLLDSIQNVQDRLDMQKLLLAMESESIRAENEILKQKHAREDVRFIILTLLFLIIVIGLFFAYLSWKRRSVLKEKVREAKFTQSLLELSRTLNKLTFNYDEFVTELLTQSRIQLNCDRATYWCMDSKKEVIFLFKLVDNDPSTSTPDIRFTREQFPKILSEFGDLRTLAIADISKEERLSDIYKLYFKPAGINSILNVPIFVDGAFFGQISFTMAHHQTREWNIQEQRYAASIADLMRAAIAKKRRTELQEERKELIQKLKIRNQSLKEFNRVVSHNIREPLTQIIGFSKVLMQQELDAQTHEITSKMLESANRLDRIIKEISTILNEDDPKSGDFRIISLEKLIKEVLDLLQDDIASTKAVIEIDLNVKKVKTHKPFLTDVLYYVISNSLKFTKPGSSPHVIISSYENNTHWYLKISDSGRGFDMGKFGKKALQMYQRYHFDVEGRGIGLFLVNNRVSALNGLVFLESEEGVGTAITFQFPKDANVGQLN